MKSEYVECRAAQAAVQWERQCMVAFDVAQPDWWELSLSRWKRVPRSSISVISKMIPVKESTKIL